MLKKLLLLSALLSCICLPLQALTIVNQVGVETPNGNGPGGSQANTLTGGFISSDFAWVHSLGPISGTILSATLQIDLIDADNGALTMFAGTNNSGLSIGAATGTDDGGPGPWRNLSEGSRNNVINIGSEHFADIADGNFAIFGQNSMSIWGSNRSILTLEVNGVPEPFSAGLLAIGFMGLVIFRRRLSISA